MPKAILENNVPTIIDMSSLTRPERVLYVKRFLEALMQLPKQYWKPCLVFLSEAHSFAGQQGFQESTAAVIDLATRGRKRGYCAIFDTQRIAKFHKDAAAECNNVFLGRTFLDVDMKRAAEILGFTSKQDMLQMRELKEGEFYAFGQAMEPNHVHKIMVNKANTTHPKAGGLLNVQVSPPTPKIKEMLTKLALLPQQEKEVIKDKQDHQKRIKDLETQLRQRQPLPVKDTAELQRMQTLLKENMDKAKLLQRQLQQAQNVTKSFKTEVITKLKNIISMLERPEKDIPEIILKTLDKRIEDVKQAKVFTSQEAKEQVFGTITYGRCEREIYNFLNSNQDRTFTKIQIAAMIGYSPKSSGFNNSMGKLNSIGALSKRGNGITIGQTIPDMPITSNTKYSLDLIKSKLGKCEREIFEVLLDHFEDEYTKEELAEATASRYSAISSGYNNSLGKLNSLGFIQRQSGSIRLSTEIKEML